MSEALEKSVPKGSVAKMVKKIMQNEAMSTADELSNESTASVEEHALDAAVKNVVKKEVQAEKAKPKEEKAKEEKPKEEKAKEEKPMKKSHNQYRTKTRG